MPMMQKPRPFSLEPIYSDRRSERLKGVFATRRKQGGGFLSLPMLLSVLLLVAATALLLVFS